MIADLVALIVVVAVFLVSMGLFVRRARREIREGSRPAPLESGDAREAVRASMERRR